MRRKGLTEQVHDAHLPAKDPFFVQFGRRADVTFIPSLWNMPQNTVKFGRRADVTIILSRWKMPRNIVKFKGMHTNNVTSDAM